MRYAVAIFVMEVSKQTYFAWTGPDHLVLSMISRPYMRVTMDSLMTVPRTHIMLQHPRAGEQVPEETEAIRRVGHEFLKNYIIPNKDIEGKKPKANLYTKWQGIDIDANQIYGLSSQETLLELFDYGQLNGGFIPHLTQMRGSCMFHALRKGMKCPWEFSTVHLQCMVVLFAIENFEMLWPLLHICVLNNFGHIRLTEEEYRAKVDNGTITDAEHEAYSELGPFSIYAYVDNMLKPKFYGNELCLFIISMILKVHIMVLHAESLKAIKIHHMNQSMKADFILVHCSGSHYIPLGMTLYIIFYSYSLITQHLYTIYIQLIHTLLFIP